MLLFQYNFLYEKPTPPQKQTISVTSFFGQFGFYILVYVCVGGGYIALPVLILGTSWRWSASRPDCFIPAETVPIHIAKEIGWAQKPVWRWCQKEKISTSARNRNPVVQLVA
jgi:hypothetical protein